MKKCYVATCKNYRRKGDITFFRMTKERYDTWMRAIGRNIDLEPVSYERIVCSDHFLPEDVVITDDGKLQVKKEAVPIPNLKSNKKFRLDGPPSSPFGILRSEELFLDPSHKNGHFRIEHITVVPEGSLGTYVPNAEIIETDTLSTLSTISTSSTHSEKEDGDNEILDAKHFISLLRTFHSYSLPPGKMKKPVVQKKLNNTTAATTRSKSKKISEETELGETLTVASEDTPKKPTELIRAFHSYSSSQKLKVSLETSIRQKRALMKRVNSYKAKVRRLSKKIVYIRDAIKTLKQKECIW